MIRKKLKFYFVFLLIISLVAPAYCANAASDPSAFLTKKEFDEALSDFGRRLASFEAGIGAKIDNQVTSYLDRNGIWSGKTQTIDTASSDAVGWDKGPYKSVSAKDSVYYLTPKNGTVTFGVINNENLRPARRKNFGYKDYEIIHEVNKTGLLFINYTFKSSLDGNNYFRGGLACRTNDGSVASWSTLWTLKFQHKGVDTYIDSKNLTVSNVMMQAILLPTTVGLAMFFVDKGHPINMNFGCTMICYDPSVDWNTDTGYILVQYLTEHDLLYTIQIDKAEVF